MKEKHKKKSYALRAASHEQDAGDRNQNTELEKKNEPAASNEQIATSNPLLTHNPEPITPNMEVHKHPHHVMHKKKWPEYLLEFLMLFLAVFLGFVAENIREESLEHQRARQYASTMLQDLEADKEALEEGISGCDRIHSKIDTLLLLSAHDKQVSIASFYYYGRYGYRFWHYVDKQVTLEQMKHSGTIRYFNNSILENRLVAFDKAISFIHYWEGREAFFEQRGGQFAAQLFNYDILQKIPLDSTTHEPSASPERLEATDPVMRNHIGALIDRPEAIREYLNFCFLRIPILNVKKEFYRKALEQIEDLKGMLRREYDLK